MSTNPSHSANRTAYSAGPLYADTTLPPAGPSSPHESELKYQRLVEGIGGDYILYTHDPDGKLTYVSPSIENVLGFVATEVVGLNWRDLVGEHFVGRDLAEQVNAEVAAGKKFYKFTVEISHALGKTRLLEIQQRPLFDSTGQYTSMEGIAKDVTEVTRNAQEFQKLQQDLEKRVVDRTAELKRSNELLRASEARYRTVVESQTEFVVRWLPGGIFTFVNEAYCRLLDRSYDQLIGWCFLPTIFPEDRQAFEEAINSLTQESPLADFENRILLPDGSACWTHWTNQKLYDDQGRFLEFQSVGRDITELKIAADTIREKEAHLAHVSRLAMMGELVAGMAHEIHQPLHAAKTFAEAARRNLEMCQDPSKSVSSPLLDNSNIETAIDCTKEISDAISRTAKIIRHLREFTQSCPGEFEQLDLNQVVREASELIVFETRQAKVKLNFELSANKTVVQGDRIQLVQACVNLLMNAYEAMAGVPETQRQIRIRTVSDTQRIQLSFQDNGKGITLENTDLLFDAFYSTKSQGMGMGLSMCKSIAEAHGGTICGRPNDGPGMNFTLELPLLQSQFLKQPQTTIDQRQSN